MKKFSILLVVALVLVAGMTSCKKGDTGPAGPVGPAGPDSTVYSAWISLSFTYIPADTVLLDTVNAPSVTQGILDSGIILTYLNLGTATDYHVVPVSGTETYSLTEDYGIGKIYLYSYQYDFTGVPFRYVTIPGSKKEGNDAARTYKGYSAAELKAMPYEQVRAISSEKN